MKETSLVKEVDTYIDTTFIGEQPDLDFAIQNAKKHNLPPIHVHPVFGKFLYTLAKMSNAKHILELGTLGGYSTIWLAKALPEDGRIITVEHNGVYANVAEENFKQSGVQNKIELKTGEALKLLPTLEQTFDFFFIDANKEEYVDYIDWAIKLGKPGSVIICDNVIRNGGVLQEKTEKEYYAALQKFNAFIAKHPQLDSTVLPTMLALTGRDYLDGMSISIIK